MKGCVLLAKAAWAPKPAEIHAGNVSELKKRIKEGKVSGSYVFYGDEEYTKTYFYDELTGFCGNKALNVKTLAGADFTLKDFMNSCDTAAADSMDMFALDEEEEEKPSCRLVRLIAPKLDVLGKKELNEFLSRIEDPDDGVIIVLWLYAGEQDKISKGIYKKIADASLVLNFRREAVGSPSLAAWIIKHFKRGNIDIERSVAMFMCTYVGNDMTTLKNAIDSCISYLNYEKRTEVTAADIEFICKKSESAQIFDISDNALKGDYAAAMAAFSVYAKSSKSPERAASGVFAPILKAVYDLCTVERCLKTGIGQVMISKKTGLHEFVVKKYVNLINTRSKSFNGKGTYAEYASELCLEYDTKNKSSVTNKYELIRELIFKLCYPDSRETGVKGY